MEKNGNEKLLKNIKIKHKQNNITDKTVNLFFINQQAIPNIKIYLLKKCNK